MVMVAGWGGKYARADHISTQRSEFSDPRGFFRPKIITYMAHVRTKGKVVLVSGKLCTTRERAKLSLKEVILDKNDKRAKEAAENCIASRSDTAR